MNGTHGVYETFDKYDRIYVSVMHQKINKLVLAAVVAALATILYAHISTLCVYVVFFRFGRYFGYKTCKTVSGNGLPNGHSNFQSISIHFNWQSQLMMRIYYWEFDILSIIITMIFGLWRWHKYEHQCFVCVCTWYFWDASRQNCIVHIQKCRHHNLKITHCATNVGKRQSYHHIYDSL